MVTDQKHLVGHVLSVTETLIKDTEDPEHLDLLQGARAVLNELLLRTERSFYLASFEAGCALLSSCLAELGEEDDALQDALDNRSGPDEIGQATATLQRRLSGVVKPLARQTSARSEALLHDIVAWQDALNGRHLAPTAESVAPAARELTQERIRDYLRKRFPDRNSLELSRFTVLSGGFSKTTMLLETTENVGSHTSIVIRAEQDQNLLFYDGADVRREYPMIELMQREGIPVAEPLWLETDKRHIGNRFIVSKRLDGHSPGGNLGSEEHISDALIDDFFRVMARLNALEVKANDPLVQASHLAEWMAFGSLTDCLRFYASDFMWRLVERSEIEPTPEIERAMAWLADNVPQCDEKPSIIHMDFNWNNLLVKNDRIQAVLDWESSHLGDPAEELISSLPSLRGIMGLDEMVATYRHHTGKEISQFRLCYAHITKFVANAITIERAQKMLSLNRAAPIRLAMLAFPYRGHFLTGLNELIEQAEAAR